jgi:arsenite-transporting ATPase
MVNKKGKNLFFLGKGGTGKTTIAALTATALAEKGEKVVLLSMDPAHNLFDVFQINSSKSAVKLQDNFIIEEIDIQYWIKTYLKSIEKKIARSYQHLTALSLEKHIKTIRYSPGMEEYALQYAFEAVEKKYKGYVYLLFDMPPTALALRFFNLPILSLIWLEQLIDLRKKILEKQKIINDVYQKDFVKSDDKILNQLYRMQSDNEKILRNFQDVKKSGIYIVLNEDNLSLSESADIYEMISENRFSINGILVNKYQDVMKQGDFGKKIALLALHFFPLGKHTLIGMTALKEYINNETFQQYIYSIIKNVAR